MAVVEIGTVLTTPQATSINLTTTGNQEVAIAVITAITKTRSPYHRQDGNPLLQELVALRADPLHLQASRFRHLAILTANPMAMVGMAGEGGMIIDAVATILTAEAMILIVEAARGEEMGIITVVKICFGGYQNCLRRYVFALQISLSVFVVYPTYCRISK